MNHTTAFDHQAEARSRIQTLKKELRTWDRVSRETGVNKGLLWSIAKGVKPAPDTALVALKVISQPLKMVAVAEGFDVAPVCKVCGLVHVAKGCTLNRKPRVKRAYKVGDMRRLTKARKIGVSLI